jgi:hypothetical protein
MKGTRKPRPIVFVCIGMKNASEFVSKVIRATSQAEAVSLFMEQTQVQAQEIHGPFRPKKAQVLENTRTLRFTDRCEKVEYDGWEVNAMFLKEPADQAYLIFIRRLDGKKYPAPKGTVVVPVSQLRTINE